MQSSILIVWTPQYVKTSVFSGNNWQFSISYKATYLDDYFTHFTERIQNNHNSKQVFPEGELKGNLKPTALRVLSWKRRQFGTRVSPKRYRPLGLQTGKPLSSLPYSFPRNQKQHCLVPAFKSCFLQHCVS